MAESNRKQRLNPAALSLATRAIHGKKLFPFQGPVTPAIFQTSTYRFADSHDAVRYARGDPDVYVYTRYHNPTVSEVEERLALTLGTQKVLLVASGMAAISSAIMSVVHSGDEIISTPALYGGTYRFFRDILPGLNINVRYVRPDELERIGRAATRRTKVVYFETPTNPTLGIVDIRAIVEATRAAQNKAGHKILIMIDNTFATIANQNPLGLGVDVVLESGTKYLGGHSDLLAGIVAGTEKFVRGAHTQMKYFGGCADPFAAFLMLRSLKTFELRVERQNQNALALAHFLESCRNVNLVLYPGLPSHPQHAIARKQMGQEAGGKGFGGMVTIEVRGGVQGAVKVCNRLQVAVNAMSLGGAETLVSIPVYSSHIGMSAKELRSHGVTPGMIRISVGLEGIDDLKHDFARALNALS
jgi:cystathionine beta-lyase/cystathionine gamma-synthase